MVLASCLAAACQNNTIELEQGATTSSTAAGSASDGDDQTSAGETTTTEQSTGIADGDSDGDDDGRPDSSDLPRVSFSEDVVPILQSTCVPTCHEQGGEWEFLDLDIDPWSSLVSVPASQLLRMSFVEPGSLESSYLWHKINDTHFDVGGKGLPMPKPSQQVDPELTDAQIDAIAAWILQGAQND